MARNLALELAAAYDRALETVDVLVLPTLPITATPIPAPYVPREESIARSSEMIVNTAPFDVTGHPATTVPAGLVDGLPAGLMIVGPQFGDAACLRVAQAYEKAVGGFPAPAAAPFGNPVGNVRGGGSLGDIAAAAAQAKRLSLVSKPWLVDVCRPPVTSERQSAMSGD